MTGYPFPLADPDDPGLPPAPIRGWNRALAPVKRTLRRVSTHRRLAVLDSHFPWRISGFRYHEAEEIFRQLPNTLFFSLYRLTDPFPAKVHPLAEFPTLAVAAGVTDIHMVFLNFCAGILGIEGQTDTPMVPGARRDISVRETLDRWKIRAHVTLYPGGGLSPEINPSILSEVGSCCSTVFTTVPAVRQALPAAVPTQIPIPTDFYRWTPSPDHDGLVLLFVADDRPRKGLRTLLECVKYLGAGFTLEVVGPHDRYKTQLAEVGAVCHGWSDPEKLREVFSRCDVMVAPATRDLLEDGWGDPGMIDGFPTTAAKLAMLSGCCLVGSNPLGNQNLIQAGEHYIEVPERDPRALANALIWLRDNPSDRKEIAGRGATVLRQKCDSVSVVRAKLTQMGLL